METKKMIPYGAAILGVVVGNWLYKKKPMYGNIGRGVAVVGGAVGAYYISNAIINRFERKEIESAASMNVPVSAPETVSED